MKNTLLRALVLVSSILSCGCGGGGGSSAIVENQSYTTVTLKDITPPDLAKVGSGFVQITHKGVVVAVTSDLSAMFVISNGTTTEIQPPEKETYFPVAISESGEIVGWCLNDSRYLIRNGIITNSAIPTSYDPLGILDNGAVLVDIGGELAEYSTDVQPIAFPQTLNWGFTDGNQIVGSVGPLSTVAYRYDGTQFTKMLPSPGFPNLAVSDVNSLGYVIGSSRSAQEVDPGSIAPNLIAPCVWSPSGTVSVLPSPAGLIDCSPGYINDAGEIVGLGYSSTSDNFPTHCILWRNGTAQDITSLLPANLKFFSLYGIDNAGNILMNLTDSHGQLHLDLVTPSTPTYASLRRT